MESMTDIILAFFAWSGLAFWAYGVWRILN